MTTTALPLIGASLPREEAPQLWISIAKVARPLSHPSNRASSQELSLRLEPYAGKLASTVLRGAAPSNGRGLPALTALMPARWLGSVCAMWHRAAG